MQRALSGLVLSLSVLAAGTAEAKDLNSLLQGDYAAVSSDSCLGAFTAQSPFNADFTIQPNVGAFTNTLAIQAIYTFNGDGTGSRQGTALTMSSGSATEAAFQGGFTYQVNADLSFSLVSDTVTGTLLNGTRAGQTFTDDNLAMTGQSSADASKLTLAEIEPLVEELNFSGAPSTEFRVCARSTSLIKLN